MDHGFNTEASRFRMFLTYDIVRHVPANRIQEEFFRETMSVYLLDSSKRLGGPNKTVEIDESKFGKRKYHRGHHVQGQWIFGGVERGTGRAFFVPVQDRTTGTLSAVIRAWIEPGTRSSAIVGRRTIVSIRKVTRNVFVDPDTGVHTNTTESCWRRLKVFAIPLNRKRDYIYELAHYMFVARCKTENVDQLTKFLHIAATTD
jgi:hypothetical protein